MEGRFVEVPPPATAPVYEDSEKLGLPRGLRAEKNDRQFRCASCGKMKKPGSWGAWVPDGMTRSDPNWAFTEQARQLAYNGGWSFWCLRCAGGTDPGSLLSRFVKTLKKIAFKAGEK